MNGKTMDFFFFLFRQLARLISGDRLNCYHLVFTYNKNGKLEENNIFGRRIRVCQRTQTYRAVLRRVYDKPLYQLHGGTGNTNIFTRQCFSIFF